MIDDSVFNLDALTTKKIRIGGKDYEFNLPPLSKLKPLAELDSKVKGIDDPEEIVGILAEELSKLIPEIPKELYSQLNALQLKALTSYLTSGDVADGMVAVKKKL